MYYELYVDSLFVVNFVMNLYLLMLVNLSTLRTATRRRMLMGAGVGAICYLLPFMVNLPVWLKYPVAFLGGAGLMIHIVFRPGSVKGFIQILKRMVVYSFLMGGLLLFVKEIVSFWGTESPGHSFSMGMWAVCGIGALGAMFLSYLSEKRRRQALGSSCRATLICGSNKVSVQALLDSGNSLVEPISGKPVTVIDMKIYHALWGDKEQPFRAIPYHSIGRKRGILKGYLLPVMELEIDGVTKQLKEVYVAVSEESGGESVIINPAII